MSGEFFLGPDHPVYIEELLAQLLLVYYSHHHV